MHMLTLFLPSNTTYKGTKYKGENITKLTLEPALVRFDTFDSLVMNNFKILLRRIPVSTKAFEYFKEYLNIKQANGHEAYPIVIELWFHVILKF